MENKENKNAVHLEKDETVSSGVFDRVEVWRGNVSGEYHVSSKKTQDMAGKHQKAVNKAVAAKERTQKTVYRLERVYDKSTGGYTFQTVSHRVDKDYGKHKKSKGKKVGGFVVSKGKEAIQAAWRSSSQIQAGNGDIQDSISDAAKAGFETTKKGIKAFGVLEEDILKYNKKRAVKLQNRADFSGFQLEGRKEFEKEFANKVKEGKISQNSARRAMQKEVIKKKYQSQAVLKYAQQKSKAVAFLTSSSARKKMLKAVAAATKKYLIIGGAVILLLCALLGGCAIISMSLFGGGSMVSLGVYSADKEELEEAEYYFNRLEMLLAEAICDFSNNIYGYYGTDTGRWTGSDGKEYNVIVEYDLDAIHHDPSVLINYLTVLYGDFKINMGDLNADPVANEIDSLFYSCYGLRVPDATEGGWFQDDIINGFNYKSDENSDGITSICDFYTTSRTIPTPRTDANGQFMYDQDTHELLMDERQCVEYHYKIGGSHAFRSLEDVVQERVDGFNSELQARYRLISETNGALQQARNIMGEDIDIHERVVDYYGNCLTNTDYSYNGWRPPNEQSWAQDSRNYVSLRCDSGGNNIYAGMNGTVSAVGSGTVTIKNANSGIFSANYITFENLNTVNVVQNQTVTPGTVIGSCNDLLYIYYQEEEALSGKTYRNPLFYFN
ncbi:MAG: M23 family metallopeptidase [Lachnospiraceae bacterium]|nr:M23 family metallopeptidase [Lachnospiraceae bacterium]